MTHETQNVARQHAIAARTALEAFRHHQPDAGLDWSSFDTAVGLLAYNLFKDVLQRDESQNPPAFLTHQGHGTVGLEKQLERRGHVVVGLQEAGRIEGILQNDRSPQAEEEQAAISSSHEDQDD